MLDILEWVDEKNRGRTIPIRDARYAWWTNAVLREVKKHHGGDLKAFSIKIDIEYTRVWKCVYRKVPTYGLLVQISDALGVPYPVILPENEDEAFELAKQKRLLKSDAQVREIQAGVPSNTQESQTIPIASEHAIRPRKRRPKQRRVRVG